MISSSLTEVVQGVKELREQQLTGQLLLNIRKNLTYLLFERLVIAIAVMIENGRRWPVNFKPSGRGRVTSLDGVR
jgi:hypothetical protein